MPNLKLYLKDLGKSRVQSIYLNRDIAVLELMTRERSIYTQIQINMNVDVSARPFMAGELEKEPFLRKAFYLGKVFGRENEFDLTEDYNLTVKSVNQFGHDFTLELPAKNDLGEASWWITQGGFDQSRDVFFKCNHEGIISTPQETLPDSLWFFETFAREEYQNDEKTIQNLKCKRLVSVHFGYPMRLFFSHANDSNRDNLDIWFNNEALFSGQMALKADILKDQYRNCESEIDYCWYAQFIDRLVENVTLKNSGDLILDFDNKTTLTIKGNPPSDEYDDIIWTLSESRTRKTLYECWVSEQPFPQVQIKKTRFTQRDLLKHIDSYMKLQIAILNLFADEYPHARRHETFNQCPKNGTIYLNGTAWGFWKHGLGFCFTHPESGVELNVHTNCHEPETLDEWRIFCYLNSLFPNDKIDFETIKSTMQELANKGGNALHKIGTLYTWDVKKTKNIFPSFLDFLRKK